MVDVDITCHVKKSLLSYIESVYVNTYTLMYTPNKSKKETICGVKGTDEMGQERGEILNMS